MLNVTNFYVNYCLHHVSKDKNITYREVHIIQAIHTLKMTFSTQI